jgi:hypothetical protein
MIYHKNSCVSCSRQNGERRFLIGQFLFFSQQCFLSHIRTRLPDNQGKFLKVQDFRILIRDY